MIKKRVKRFLEEQELITLINILRSILNLKIDPNSKILYTYRLLLRRRIKAVKTKRLKQTLSYSETPNVSFIIQSYNHKRNIKHIVDSLRLCNAEEIIACDDGSIDGSLKKWQKHLTKPNEFIIHSNDIHEIRTYNRAANFAKGDILCFMQDDDILPKTDKWVRDALELFRLDPDLAVLGGDGGRDPVISQEMSLEKFSQQKKIRSIDLENQQINFLYTAMVSVGPIFIRRNHFIEIGEFDLTYSLPGHPGIWFDYAFSTETWLFGKKVGVYKNDIEHGKLGRGTKIFGHKHLRIENHVKNFEIFKKSYLHEQNKVNQLVKRANNLRGIKNPQGQ